MSNMDEGTSKAELTAGSSPARLAAIVVGGILALAVLWVGWDIWVRRTPPLDCGDGPRYAIETRQFATQYSAYSVQLEASIADKSKVSLRLDPVQQQKLSDALESANEFRKYVVAGYNSCAVTKPQYAKFGARLQALDGLAREIDGLSAKTGRTAAENEGLSKLIARYSDLAHSLGSEDEARPAS